MTENADNETTLEVSEDEVTTTNPTALAIIAIMNALATMFTKLVDEVLAVLMMAGILYIIVNQVEIGEWFNWLSTVGTMVMTYYFVKKATTSTSTSSE